MQDFSTCQQSSRPDSRCRRRYCPEQLAKPHTCPPAVYARDNPEKAPLLIRQGRASHQTLRSKRHRNKHPPLVPSETPLSVMSARAHPHATPTCGRSWKRMAASMALTRSSKAEGTSADRVMAMRSSRCSRRAPSSGLYVAIRRGRQLWGRWSYGCGAAECDQQAGTWEQSQRIRPPASPVTVRTVFGPCPLRCIRKGAPRIT
jgi:hypothetical protein